MKVNLSNSNLGADPIANYYEKYKVSSQQVIEPTINSWLQDAKQILDGTLKQHQDEIKKLQDEINTKYEQDGIHAKKITNVVILVFCVIIIGLFFLGFYFKNKKIIQEYEQYESEMNQKIEEQKQDLFHVVYSNMVSLKTSDLFGKIFSEFGLTTSPQINSDNLVAKLNKSNLLGIDKANVVYLRNTPIYDLSLRELNIRNVVTYGQIEVSENSEGGSLIGDLLDGGDDSSSNEETTTKILTASHTEPTPFIDSINEICLLSNYLQPEFSLISDGELNEIDQRTSTIDDIVQQEKQAKQKGLWNKIKNATAKKFKDLVTIKKDKGNEFKLENDIFNKEIRYEYHGSETDLTQFFNIKVQEDFVNWNEHFDNLTNKGYGFGTYAFYDEKQLTLPFNSYFESVLTTCDYTDPDKVSTMKIDELKGKLVSMVTNYLDDWFKATQVPLLVTGINREWYQPNGHYMAGFAGNTPTMDTNTSTQFLLNKWRRMFTFSQAEPKRDSWIKITNPTAISDNLTAYDLTLNSYGSEERIDQVKVSEGVFDNYRVPVKYEYFFPIVEVKKAYRFKVNKWPANQDLELVMGALVNNNISNNYPMQIRNLVQKAPMMISNPLLINNSQYHQNIIKKVVNFFNNNQEFNQYCLLVLSNQYDGLILVNNPDWFTDNQMENKIQALVNELNA